MSALSHDLVTCPDLSITFYCVATVTSRSIDFPWGRFVRLTRANGLGGIRASCYSWTRRFLSRQQEEEEEQWGGSKGRGGETRVVSDAEKSPLFFLEASRPRMQLVVSLKDFSVFDERVFTSWSASFGKNSPSSRQINSSTLIYLRRVIRWLSRLLALICSCLRDICALSVKIWCLQQMFAAFSWPDWVPKQIDTPRCYEFIK